MQRKCQRMQVENFNEPKYDALQTYFKINSSLKFVNDFKKSYVIVNHKKTFILKKIHKLCLLIIIIKS